MAGPDKGLLSDIRAAAAVVVLVLFAYAVIVDRDVTVLGMIFGALAVLLGLASVDLLQRRGP